MHRLRIPLALTLAVTLAAPLARAESPAAELPKIPFEMYELPNKLTVVLSEDHTVPIATVYLVYLVGSKDEKLGRTGFAHLFEHVMFQGSKHVGDDQHFKLLESIGGNVNGNTTQDRTVYFETVPSNYVERALWLESDRMGFLLDTLDQGKLDQQRDVVKNERRQSYENRPYGLAYEKILAALYPETFPYHWPTIGSMADLTAASLDDVKGFFQNWYVPSNAAIFVVGDIDKAQVKGWIEKYFAPFPGGERPTHTVPAAPAPLTKEVRLSYNDNVQLPRLYLNWRTPPHLSSEDIALDVVASVLGGGRSSRLYQRLVFSEIATDIDVGQDSSQLSSMFSIVATARPGHTLAEIEKIIDEEIAKLAAEPPSQAEVDRAQTALEAGTTFGLESTYGRAIRMGSYWQVTGDPGFLTKDIAMHRAVTPADVSAMAKKFLGRDQRVALEVLPNTPAPAKK
jgi:zinc protease